LEDPDEVQKWKWSLKKAKKTNRELHAERCDTELKLSVLNIKNHQSYFLRYWWCNSYAAASLELYLFLFFVNRLLVK
jgi:DNA-directed RNA polymerase